MQSNGELQTSGHRTDPAAGDLAGIVFDVKRFAIHDGPGIRTTVFLKGCPLRCRWCHNPESLQRQPEHSVRPSRCTGCQRCVAACDRGALGGATSECAADRRPFDADKCVLCGACVEACPTGAREILGRRVGVDQMMAEIERDVIFYDQSGGGVTFSGGEPLAQPTFLAGLLRQCKSRGIHTVVDTTCHARWETIEAIASHVDLFLCDVKHMDRAAHERFAGVSNELILQNVRRLARLGQQIIIRIPVIPGINDDEANLAATARFVSSLEGVSRIDLLPQNGTARAKAARLTTAHDLLDLQPPPAEQMEAIAARLQRCGFSVKIGG